MSYDIGPRKKEGLKKKNYRIVLLVNEAYKMRVCGLSNEECGVQIFEILFILK
jgi:hypothetical protein